MTFDFESTVVDLALQWANTGYVAKASLLAALQRAHDAGRTSNATALAVTLATVKGHLEHLRRMAADPMRSWDSGRVVDAQLVDEEAEDALAAIETLAAAPPPAGTGG